MRLNFGNIVQFLNDGHAVKLSEIHDPFANLSPEQRISIMLTIGEWKSKYRAGLVNLDTRRVIPGAIPTWADWSGCAWVDHECKSYRRQMFRNGMMHICIYPHLALPPFWTPQHPNEIEAVRRYGHWSGFTTWVPPEVIKSRTVWIERP